MTSGHGPDLDTLTGRLLADYDRRAPGTPFAEGLRLAVGEAYRLQDGVARLRAARGERHVGYKIGCVAPVNQTRHGLAHPVRGHLWSTEQHATGSALRTSEYANLAVEAELAVVLGRRIGPAMPSVLDVARAVEQVLVVIELHNLVLRGIDPTGPELIANNAIHAGVVRGLGVAPPPLETPVDLSLELDGRVAGRWVDRVWPHDILTAVPWLVGHLAGHGLGLAAGQLILVGAWGPPVPLRRAPLAPGRDVPEDGPARDRSDVAASIASVGKIVARSNRFGSAEATTRTAR